MKARSPVPRAGCSPPPAALPFSPETLITGSQEIIGTALCTSLVTLLKGKFVLMILRPDTGSTFSFFFFVSAQQMSIIINSWKRAIDTHNTKRLRTILHQSSSLNLIVDNKIHDTLKLKAHVGCLWISTYVYEYKCLSTHAHAHANIPAYTSAFFRKHHRGTRFSSENLSQLRALHFFLVTFHQFVSITRAWT